MIPLHWHPQPERENTSQTLPVPLKVVLPRIIDEVGERPKRFDLIRLILKITLFPG